MKIRPELAWAAVCFVGQPRPFIHEDTTRTSVADTRQCIGKHYAREGETWQQGWRRAFRCGWRCRRVLVTLTEQKD